MLDFSFPAILNLFPQHLSPKRSRSASFLIWYLENYYRLHTLEAQNSVCDFRGDKGVDGIFVNDNDQTITIFQATIIESSSKKIGDKTLRTFDGTINQFRSVESIRSLLDSKPNTQLESLIKRLDLISKVETYSLQGEFLCNIDQDTHADGVLATSPYLSYVGETVLKTTYISDQRDTPIHTPKSFDIVGRDVTKYMGDTETKVIIAAVKATELVALDGIANQSLYKYNVRGPLTRSSVNRQIRETIRKPEKHKYFPLFHNGITIIANELESDEESISISDYFVVNGCQSLTALYENQRYLTDDLRVLTKFIKLEPSSTLAEEVTRFSNNQNAVKVRDFVANDPIQIRLQNEFATHYKGEYYYEIKRGELPQLGVMISNETAGLILRSFDFKEPWITHRTGEVLDPEKKYRDIFARPEVTADRILLTYLIWEIASEELLTLTNDLVAKYNLTPYVLVYIVRNILENDAMFTEITTHPEEFVRNEIDRERFKDCVRTILKDVIIDVNAKVEEYGENFDYRDRLRNSQWVKELNQEVVSIHLKLIKRGTIKSFGEEWRDKV
ncbi:MAG TPA: AIPR family protein [Pyrinomonadaceae bacterium]